MRALAIGVVVAIALAVGAEFGLSFIQAALSR
jgi:hypothetical protein